MYATLKDIKRLSQIQDRYHHPLCNRRDTLELFLYPRTLCMSWTLNGARFSEGCGLLLGRWWDSSHSKWFLRAGMRMVSNQVLLFECMDEGWIIVVRYEWASLSHNETWMDGSSGKMESGSWSSLVTGTTWVTTGNSHAVFTHFFSFTRTRHCTPCQPWKAMHCTNTFVAK